MAIIQNDGKRQRRRPSLKGGVMLDVVNGQERARAWPKKRGKKLHPATVERNEWFRQAQWATKYMDAEMYWQAQQAVQGTPLLPRDVLTMMMSGRLATFVMPDGKQYWSRQVVDSVSESLDVITAVPGTMLFRGPDRWIGIGPTIPGTVLSVPDEGGNPQWLPPSGGGGGGGGMIAEIRLIADAPSITFDEFPDAVGDLTATWTARTNNAEGLTQLRARVNSNAGAVYDFERMHYFGNGGDIAQEAGQTSMMLGYVAGNAAEGGRQGSGQVLIPDIAGTALMKTLQSSWSAASGTGGFSIGRGIYGGNYRPLEAVTSLTLFPASGSFLAGSRFALYAAI
jgi:hypothetical protein